MSNVDGHHSMSSNVSDLPYNTDTQRTKAISGINCKNCSLSLGNFFFGDSKMEDACPGMKSPGVLGCSIF